MIQWLQDNTTLLWAVGIASAIVFLGSLLAMPALVARLPADYFAHDERPPSRWAREHPALRLTIFVVRNVLGVMLVVSGVAMLVLPGQGILTIVAGFVLMDFPKKYAIERWIICKRLVHRPINWIRTRRDRPPLRLPRCGDREPRDEETNP